MRKNYFYIISGFIAGFLVFLLFSGVNFPGIFRETDFSGDVEKKELIFKNKKLENELDNLRHDFSALQLLGKIKRPFSSYDYLIGRVFYQYPFNTGHRLIIDLGLKTGPVKSGMPVLAGDQILVGKIVKAGDYLSEVKTILDADWEESVIIGDKKIPGILKGGRDPQVVFIEKNADFKEGDLIKNASPNFPYGLLMGTASVMEDKPDAPFKSARLDFFYNINRLNDVLVITNYNADF